MLEQASSGAESLSGPLPEGFGEFAGGVQREGESMLRSAPGLRFIAAPPPRCVSIYTACGGIGATSACHSPDADLDPNPECPMAPTIGPAPYDVMLRSTPPNDKSNASHDGSRQNENCWTDAVNRQAATQRGNAFFQCAIQLSLNRSVNIFRNFRKFPRSLVRCDVKPSKSLLKLKL